MLVTFSAHAPDGCRADFVQERLRRDLAAGVCVACCVPAGLCGVRCSNPFEPDAFS